MSRWRRNEAGASVGVQVAGRDGRILKSGDPLQEVQLDASIGHPGERGVAQAVSNEA